MDLSGPASVFEQRHQLSATTTKNSILMKIVLTEDCLRWILQLSYCYAVTSLVQYAWYLINVTGSRL